MEPADRQQHDFSPMDFPDDWLQALAQRKLARAALARRGLMLATSWRPGESRAVFAEKGVFRAPFWESPGEWAAARRESEW